jgi:hypothetical protein
LGKRSELSIHFCKPLRYYPAFDRLNSDFLGRKYVQFVGKLSEADLKEVQRLRRTKMYWAWLIMANKYLIVFGVIAVAATISGFVGWSQADWPLTAIFWLVVIAYSAWVAKRKSKNEAKALTYLNTKLPDRILLAADGVKLEGPNGVRVLPWQNFRGWREGQRVVLVAQRERRKFVTLPVAQLSDAEREQMRQLLQSHIPTAIQ